MRERERESVSASERAKYGFRSRVNGAGERGMSVKEGYHVTVSVSCQSTGF